MVWLLVGVALGGIYGWLWCLIWFGRDGDDVSMREWDRQQAEWRGDRR